MKPLEYRELLWDISNAPSGQGFVVVAFDDEAQMFTAAPTSASEVMPIDLGGLMGKSDVSTQRWTRRRISASEAQSVGMKLWFALPPVLRDPVEHGIGPIRLKISTNIAGVGDIPWEWLNDGISPPFALRTDTTLVRSVPLRFPVHPLSVELPLRVLLLVPNPKDERLINAPSEITTIIQGLPAPDFDVRILDVPMFDQVVKVLAEQQPNIVHYVGHGGLVHGEGNLILPDSDGRSRWVSASELASLLPTTTRLLCLSTPVTTDNYQVLGLSHLARAAGLSQLPTTVVNQYPIDAIAAGSFWTDFYASLRQGRNVSQAVQHARQLVAQLQPDWADWASFCLVVRDQTGVSFEIRPGAQGPRRAIEYKAQFSAELANDLAEQVQLLGDKTPAGLQQQYDFEQQRVSTFLNDLRES
jgi:hypothetical protein